MAQGRPKGHWFMALRAVTVAMAISWLVYLCEQECPAVTMLGLSSVPSRGTTPLSTLMPTTMPLLFRYSGKTLPSSVFWYIVSWKRMTPPMQELTRSSAVKRSWR
ncbi:hypothetical protein CRUP_029972 [Coryphaenoides rupestris]|nr:hypothetical protein CRUP_029972 [Coryphaenoides rupestris]